MGLEVNGINGPKKRLWRCPGSENDAPEDSDERIKRQLGSSVANDMDRNMNPGNQKRYSCQASQSEMLETAFKTNRTLQRSREH